MSTAVVAESPAMGPTIDLVGVKITVLTLRAGKWHESECDALAYGRLAFWDFFDHPDTIFVVGNFEEEFLRGLLGSKKNMEIEHRFAREIADFPFEPCLDTLLSPRRKALVH